MDTGLTAATAALAAVAFATLFAIAYQAVETRRLAAATARDVEAQWRPLLVPCERDDDGLPRVGAAGWLNMSNAGTFDFRLKNVGKGPALAIRGRALVPTVPGGRFACDDLANPVLAVDETVALVQRPAELTNPVIDNRYRVQVDYTDLSGRPHHTQIVYRWVERDVDIPDEWVIESVAPEASVASAPRKSKRFRRVTG